MTIDSWNLVDSFTFSISRLAAQQNNTVLNTNMNTIVTYNVRVPGITNPATTRYLASQVNVDVQTLDHFGRLVETQSIKATPGFNDLIQLVKYDGMGRQVKSYLPYVQTAGSLNFYGMGSVSPVSSYYTGPSRTPSIAHNSSAFSQTVFDTSPLGRVREAGAPGTNFAIGSGHKARTRVNIGGGDVAKYIVSINSSTNSRKLVSG